MAAVALIGAPGASAQSTPLEQLLRSQHDARVAHVLDDAELLTRRFADPVLSINRGVFSSATPEQSGQRFASYLRAVDFLEWDDREPPRILLSPGGEWATVILQKRVRLLRRGETVTHEAVHFAWVEQWRRSPDWQLFLVSSTERVLPLDSIPISYRILAHETLSRARRALGGDSAIADAAMTSFRAAVDGPRGPFAVDVRSARDGRGFMRQTFPNRPRYEVGVAHGRSWSRTGAGAPTDSATRIERSILIGHEVHLLAIAPESRFANPRAAEPEVFCGASADVVVFDNEYPGGIHFFFDRSSGRPAGFRARVGGDHVVDVWFDDWRPVGRVLLPHRVEFHDRADVYHYDITSASIQWLEDRSFLPGS